MSHYFFYELFGLPQNQLSLLRRQPDSPDMLIHFLIRPEDHREPYNEFWSQLPAERISAAIPVGNLAL